MYKVILYGFSLHKMNYILLINGSKGLSQGTYFFRIGFHILISDKNLLETQHLLLVQVFGSTNFVFEY